MGASIQSSSGFQVMSLVTTLSLSSSLGADPEPEDASAASCLQLAYLLAVSNTIQNNFYVQIKG